jgi:hypothetical protein
MKKVTASVIDVGASRRTSKDAALAFTFASWLDDILVKRQNAIHALFPGKRRSTSQDDFKVKAEGRKLKRWLPRQLVVVPSGRSLRRLTTRRSLDTRALRREL